MEERSASLHRFKNWKPRTHSAKGQKINQLSGLIILQAGTSELEIGHNFQLHKEDAQKRIWALASRITRSKIHTNNSDSIPDGGRSKRRPLVHSPPPFSPWMRWLRPHPRPPSARPSTAATTTSRQQRSSLRRSTTARHAARQQRRPTRMRSAVLSATPWHGGGLRLRRRFS